MKKSILLFSAILFLSSCDELLEDIADSLSTFSATVTGNVNTSFSGEANFGHIIRSQSPESSILTINLVNAEDDEESVILGIEVNNADGVQAGTYGFSLSQTEYSVAAAYNTVESGYIFPVSNKITQVIITSVEGTRVSGSFTLNLSDALDEEVEVKGTFEAIGITQTN